MPLLTLHLLRLHPDTDIKNFLRALIKDPELTLVLASQPRHLVIRPTLIDVNPLTSTKPWDLMLLLNSPDNTIPTPLQPAIRDEYKIPVGIPSKLLSSYKQHNQSLLRNASRIPLTGALDKAQARDSSQNLELSPDLIAFMRDFSKDHNGDQPVTMLNLLNFQKGGKAKYYQYGQAFVQVAGKRGGDAKIVGNVIKPRPHGQTGSREGLRKGSEEGEEKGWNEISLVHYPTIKHFCDMLAGDDYQAINTKYRLEALRDTLLLCTTEYDLEELQHGKARL
ncbi:MAG: hypothetical protein M1830_002497 [Pleopsidium flavum]|nr:MAG: hypothetical protein M1830_002497 [Pleopsidium flavum]